MEFKKERSFNELFKLSENQHYAVSFLEDGYQARMTLTGWKKMPAMAWLEPGRKTKRKRQTIVSLNLATMHALVTRGVLTLMNPEQRGEKRFKYTPVTQCRREMEASV